MVIKIEITKIFIDYIKHVNTLSTGSILILVTFIDKLFSNPLHKWLIIVSLIAFLFSIIGGFLTQSILSLNLANESKKTPDYLFIISISLLWLGFLLGIISLGVFGIINFVCR